MDTLYRKIYVAQNNIIVATIHGVSYSKWKVWPGHDPKEATGYPITRNLDDAIECAKSFFGDINLPVQVFLAKGEDHPSLKKYIPLSFSKESVIIIMQFGKLK